MKDFFRKIGNRFRDAFSGSYGPDEYSRFLMWTAVVIFVISLFVRVGILYWVGLAVLIYAYFRVFSQNYSKRDDENRKFLSRRDAFFRFFRIRKKQFRDRGQYRYFRCPSCGQEVRVPKGKGHIRITCPRCRTRFEKTV